MMIESRTISFGGDSDGRWSAYALDTFFAPHLSELTSFDAPDVRPMDEYILSFALNRSMGSKHDPRVNASLMLLSSFIRHTGPAIVEYRDARAAAQGYVAGLPNKTNTGLHAVAVARFQNCLLQLSAAQSHMASLRVLYPKQAPLFEDDDGSDHARLAKLASRIRHFHQDITGAASKRNPGPLPLAPIWLTNTSLKCRKNTKVHELTLVELASLLNDARMTARIIAEGSLPASQKPV